MLSAFEENDRDEIVCNFDIQRKLFVGSIYRSGANAAIAVSLLSQFFFVRCDDPTILDILKRNIPGPYVQLRSSALSLAISVREKKTNKFCKFENVE